MRNSDLSAVSPIDGRYRKKIEVLSEYFSEYALIKFRTQVEIEYFIALCEIPLPQLSEIGADKFSALRKIYIEFSESDALEVKEFESVTNHDVKAVEYFIKKKFDALSLQKYKEFVHFGLTSQDINNTAVPFSLKLVLEQVIMPFLSQVQESILNKSNEWSGIPLLARTHGQPASPTTMGKEIKVFVERLDVQVNILNDMVIGAKFGGATGNFNAHKVAYPDINWVDFGNEFISNVLGIQRQQTTTQIEHYDNLAAMFDVFSRINNILVDFSRDIWTYISNGYISQKIKKGEVGSSAMPHKVNPIDFENAEGNFGMANAVFAHLSNKLPISRLQRDLTDSTVLRNIGVPFAHSLIAYQSLIKGIDKLLIDKVVIERDLENHWIVVAEAIQTILRREGVDNPYEQLKELTRNNEEIGKSKIHQFIDNLDVSGEVKIELKKITPFNYIGYS